MGSILTPGMGEKDGFVATGVQAVQQKRQAFVHVPRVRKVVDTPPQNLQGKDYANRAEHRLRRLTSEIKAKLLLPIEA